MNSTDFKEQVLAVLSGIKGSGSFVCAGNKPFIFPEMEIEGIGEIGFPVNHNAVNEMIKVAHKAPFGKGSETVLDNTVRSAWEIDASKISFNGDEWHKFVGSIIEQIKPELGLQDQQITANLYKLLIYEKGDFFLTHKDSEKENGMFGSLIIGLPAKHTGGELMVKFDGRTETIDFSTPASQNKIPYAAFYADCDHEIAPVKTGYRICLTCNLIQQKGKEKIRMQHVQSYADRIAQLLKSAEDDPDMPKIVLLGHQYTPSNYSMETLKLNDRPKAEALLLAAEKAGYFAKLGLVTSYQSGELLGVGYDDNYRGRGRYHDDEDMAEEGEMGEIYDESIDVDYWMSGGVPSLDNINVVQEDIITSDEINVGDPIEKQAEGYTGNAGMEMMYWYHYGAVFLWPRKQHFDLLSNLSVGKKLEWIAYYNSRWASVTTGEIAQIKILTEAGFDEPEIYNHADYSTLADFLVNLSDENYLVRKGVALLTKYFDYLSVDSWVKLFSAYPSSCFERMFSTVAHMAKIAFVNHVLAILSELSRQNKCSDIVKAQTELIPDYLHRLDFPNVDKGVAKDILQKVLILSKQKTEDVAWIEDTADAFTKNVNREYVNDVLVAAIMESGKGLALANKILAVCKYDLVVRMNNKPQPPADWSRRLPDNAGDKKIWAILADFLQSPTQQVFDYQKLQNLRNDMDNTIRNTTIDLKMETIKKGSPYTLRLTKTQDAYERDLVKWQNDVQLLKKVSDFVIVP